MTPLGQRSPAARPARLDGAGAGRSAGLEPGVECRAAITRPSTRSGLRGCQRGGHRGVASSGRSTGWPTARRLRAQLRLSGRRQPQALRPRGRHDEVAVAGAARRRRGRRRPPARPRRASASPKAPTSSCRRPAARSCSRSSPTRRAAGTVWAAFNRRVRHHRSSTRRVGHRHRIERAIQAFPGHDVRVERRLMLGLDPHADRRPDPWTTGGSCSDRRCSRCSSIFVIGLVGTMFMVWFERKIIAGMQNRIGPNKAGPFGLLQTLADGIKLFFKEDLMPDQADRWVFRLAPFLAFVPAFLRVVGDPARRRLHRRQRRHRRVVRARHAGAAGRSTDRHPARAGAVVDRRLRGDARRLVVGSKYPLLGSVRATAQMVTYEAALGLSLAAVLLIAGTLSTAGIVDEQDRLSATGTSSPPGSCRSSSS